MMWLQSFADLLDWSPHTRPDVIFLREERFFDRHGDHLLFHVERQLNKAGYGWYRGLATRAHHTTHHHIVLFNTDRLAQRLEHLDPDNPRDPRGFAEVTVDGDDSRTVWLKSVHLDLPDSDGVLAARQLHESVPIGQRAMIAGTVTTHARNTLLGSGWHDQHTTDPASAAPHDQAEQWVADRCLTTPGLATMAGSPWVDSSTLPYGRRRAVGGIVTILTDHEAG